MRLLINLIAGLFILAVVVFGILFTMQNEAVVPLNLLGVEFSEKKVAFWVLLAFALGGVLGMLTCFFRIAKLKTDLVLLNRRFIKQEEELNNLRTSAVRAPVVKE